MSDRRLSPNRWLKYRVDKNNGGADNAAVQTLPEMPAEPAAVIPELRADEERVLRFVARYKKEEGRGPIYDDVLNKFVGYLSRTDISRIIDDLMGLNVLNKDFVSGTYGIGDIGANYLESHAK